ncbi:S41 family peptidase [Mucilaginibacter sp.]|uniref:S41 family peptidase n=1 Tax=Mucilaginibacter sp. TaxID=1882438 RepID=UPI00283C19A2|nr:S41 family peptidase [Mucilaginibacter sp.]MDR3697458.1 S41 family peptidase [Mucilaginibacter sp.]
MELLSPDKTRAAGWITYFQPAQQTAYPVKVDSVVKQQGKYSISIEKVNENSGYGMIDYIIPKTFKGEKIQLRGFLKTENVNSGYAGLWMRIDGMDKTIAFDNMHDRGVKGTTDWTEYTIDLDYDSSAAININAGALLIGDGKLWADNFKLFIDGQPIENVPVITRTLSKPERDTTFKNGSGIDTIVIDQQQVVNLTALGQLWGFLKYHHPVIAQGNYNWDAKLFRIMPAVNKAKNNRELSNVLEKWVDGLGVPPICKGCATVVDAANTKLQPDYGMLFTQKVFSASLTNKLAYILSNCNNSNGYYIDMLTNGNPAFLHENSYSKMTYPDEGYRLLCLFRYWNMINYFYPYKYAIGEDWNNVLVDCIPKFINSANATDYVLNTLALIARVHDTHANIWSNNAALSEYKGKYAVPFQAKFIGDKLVVTGYYNDTLNIKQMVKPGDVIEKINGQQINELIKKYLPYTPASNYSTQLRDLPNQFLLRSNTKTFDFDILRDGKKRNMLISGIGYAVVKYSLDMNPAPNMPGYYLINEQIGYVFPGRYKNMDLPKIEELFAKTKGIIIDMRCYPSDFMPFTFVPFIKADESGFVKFTKGSASNPGWFVFKETVTTPSLKLYKGKVVVIVNSTTQSQAEYTTMAFQSSPNVTVIGSQTAGADGDVSAIQLPGGISTMVSGLGIYYPDGTETQRKGVKIDVVVKPSIEGIKAGRDELLEKAKSIILGE